jgi:anti-sigma factor RsiW
VHPTDGSLLELIHGESSPDRVADIETHLESCPLCARRIDELRTGDAEIGRLLASLDQPVPQLSSPGGNTRPRQLRRTLLAASVALVVAGAAAAAVPGTAIHRWVQEQLGTTPRANRPAVPAVPAPASPTREQAASGIEVPVTKALTIAFAQPEEGGTLIIALADRASASLRAFGGAVAYKVAEGKIVIDNRRPAGRYELEVPNALERLTVLLGTKVVLNSDVAALRTAGGDTVFLSSKAGR